MTWALGYIQAGYHNYNLAATLGSLGCWCILFVGLIWKRWSVAKRCAIKTTN